MQFEGVLSMKIERGGDLVVSHLDAVTRSTVQSSRRLQELESLVALKGIVEEAIRAKRAQRRKTGR